MHFQGIIELDPRATVMSIDGISAYDLISRSSMMQGIHKVHAAAVPFVAMFYGTASTYLWEDDEGTTHKIVQGEGGEQGDAMMPLLFSLGQHPALEAVQAPVDPRRVLVCVFGRHLRCQCSGTHRNRVHVAPARSLAGRRDSHPPGKNQDLE